ncbi:uncharacterized protein LOC119453813 isoform X3 [Dermacentor silvarum]|uniref:uncharacterized protein LOC119453813 isoform X3 n=1 Tax=Dermacentor silvarum TaxID=543639 RepID=UPI002100A51F|nr:uncharacterized protein LOC119453813 isoform X3 [Dermacentor silvarum]
MKTLFPVSTRTLRVMALVCTVAEDIWGVPRGRCGECECDGFRRTVELISHERVPLGWSILCGHSPVAHGALTASYGMHRGTHEVAPPLARGEMFAAAAQPMAAAELEPHTSAEVSAPTTSPSTSSNLQHTTARGQTLAYKQWNKECIPQFSSYLNPFLNGHDLPVKTRQHMKAQLRDEIITFLNENNLINSPSTAVRRWQYDAFGSTLAETFPEMQFEARGPGKKIADLNFGWKAFMRSVSATRKTRMLRMKKVSDKPAESDHTSSNPIPCPDALLELKTIEDMVTDPFCMDLGRMKMLLAATAEARSSNAPDDLPSYFLNPDVLAFEAEIRFRETVEAVAAKLRKMQEILDRGSLIGLEEFVRPKKADAAVFMTAQELGNRSPPGPCILKENGNFKIAWKKNIVALPPASSPEKAVILLLTVYFILNLSYPYAFGQFLGLVQTVVKGEPFDSGLMSFKVKSLFKNLKQSGLILTC